MPLVDPPPKPHLCWAHQEAPRAMSEHYGDSRTWPSGRVWWECDECGWQWRWSVNAWVPESRLRHWRRTRRQK